MGRATQWLKSLFGIKKGKKGKNEIQNSPSLCKNPATIPPNITEAEAAWLAVAAVKLTSNGRGAAAFFVSRTEQMAALKIQRNFRGFLGRKALKGLRAVVKLQALVRGILVRKQAKATLHGMEALIRVQNIVRDKKNQSRYQNFDHFHQSYHVQKVKGRHDDTRSEYITTPHSKRLSYSFDTKMNPFDEKPMVLGPGPTRPKLKAHRTNNSVFDYNDNLFCQIHRNNLFRLSDSRNSHDQDWS